jgi:hypothetical protein
MGSAEVVQCFAYGEDLDGPSGRSLGYRLLAGAESATWTAEVENLARLLQAAPYPETWAPADLFCSVLLASGQRLVALARYGRGDHTPSHRRGGLELIGVVCSGDLDPTAALRIYSWLRARRGTTENIRQLGGRHALADILVASGDQEAKKPEQEVTEKTEEKRGQVRGRILAAPPLPCPGTGPVLPIRAWQPGVLLFGATAPAAPDRALGLLSQAPAGWQWLALCGSNFPLDEFARRGPVVAWAVEPMEVAVKLPLPAPVPTAAVPKFGRPLVGAMAGLLLLLLAANLWALWALPSRIDVPRAEPGPQKEKDQARPAAPVDSQQAREKLALAIYVLLEKEGAAELTQAQSALLARYERLAGRDDNLRVRELKARAALGLVSLLAGRSARQVSRLIEEEFQEKKGYDPELIRLISQRVGERLVAEAGKGKP